MKRPALLLPESAKRGRFAYIVLPPAHFHRNPPVGAPPDSLDPYHQDKGLRLRLEKSAAAELPAKFMLFRGQDTRRKAAKFDSQTPFDARGCLCYILNVTYADVRISM